MPPAAVLFDLYDTLVHASPGSSFYRSVPSALGVSAGRWLACYRALGPAAMTGEVPDMTSRVHLACGQANARPGRGGRGGPRPAARAVRGGQGRPPGPHLTGLRDMVGATVMSWSAGVMKPDPRIYQAALGALGVAPAEAAFVGDGGDRELQGARRLGLRTVLIERGLPHTGSARADADVCCASLADAVRALLGH